MVMRAIRSKGNRFDTKSKEKKEKIEAKKKKTVIMLMVVTILFALSYIPIHSIHFLMFFTKIFQHKQDVCNSSTLYLLCYWLGISSCAYNPFIYCYFNEEFQTEALRYWNYVKRCPDSGTDHYLNSKSEATGNSTNVIPSEKDSLTKSSQNTPFYSQRK